MTIHPLRRRIDTDLGISIQEATALAQLTGELLEVIDPQFRDLNMQDDWSPEPTIGGDISLFLKLARRNRSFLIELHDRLSTEELQVEWDIEERMDKGRADGTMNPLAAYQIFTLKMRAEFAHNLSCSKISRAVESYCRRYGFSWLPSELLSAGIDLIDFASRSREDRSRVARQAAPKRER
ncbi:hypothetical protein QA648_27685 (plasmid) [Rhizobium sp. CB3171]|uniref:hypothetical protein n=1 Tax=Rhizobium sp. CB3171 TaxID=3039157 RepID=UPI0024B0F6BA|nr:hypothetical protein [Rhizobium sp. CB3171]WFU04564.1 hypothetical protein QA648_27685 [Rhizobium sp. CB3171]